MAQNKTKPTEVDPEAFIAAVEHPVRRADAETLLDLMQRASGYEPKMWGPSIVGFGRYHYVYESGREGDSMVTGFSPRASYSSVYILPGYDDLTEELALLGKHKKGKSCLNIASLADVDLDVLERIVRESVERMQADYETFAE